MQAAIHQVESTGQRYFDRNQLHKADRAKTQLLVVQDPSGTRIHKLDRMIFTIGRSRKADIQVLGKEISRIHATLIRARDQAGNPVYQLFDGDARITKPSYNGTRINGKPVTQHILANAELIQLGLRATAKFFDLQTDRVRNLNSISKPWPQDQFPKTQEAETLYCKIPVLASNASGANASETSETITSPLINDNFDQNQSPKQSLYPSSSLSYASKNSITSLDVLGDIIRNPK
jgi:pSer/pThr/pTyr-binding forkhead associated (FHA) protein